MDNKLIGRRGRDDRDWTWYGGELPRPGPRRWRLLIFAFALIVTVGLATALPLLLLPAEGGPTVGQLSRPTPTPTPAVSSIIAMPTATPATAPPITSPTAVATPTPAALGEEIAALPDTGYGSPGRPSFNDLAILSIILILLGAILAAGGARLGYRRRHR